MEKISMIWRVFQLLLLIQDSPGRTAAELAEKCEISTRSVYRYITQLRMAGAPIVFDRGYRVDKEFSLSAVNFSLAEALAVILAGRYFVVGKMPFSKALADAVQKMLVVLPEGLRRSVVEESEHVLMNQAGPIDYARAGPMLSQIQSAVRERVCLTMEYKSLNQVEAEKRLVEPYGLVYRGDFWYLVARCRKRLDERLFRLDRMTGLSLTEERFKPQADFSLPEYMQSAWSVMRGEPKRIRVRFRGRARRIVAEGKWHPSQETLSDGDGILEVAYECAGLQEIASWVLGFGGEAEVLEPPELRRLVFETASAAAEVNE